MELAARQVQRKKEEPWLDALRNVCGQVGRDGVERISTEGLFDLLELPAARRKLPAQKRLSKVMRELNWSAIRMRNFNRGGYREQVRGYARAVERKPLRRADPRPRSRAPAQ
jgi:hypothetical protein